MSAAYVDVEVIVNNDSNDITEIAHPQVTYYYNKFDSLCEVYQSLLYKATGEYVYFLEDDDYLAPMALDIKLSHDLIVGNYCPTYNPTNMIEIMSIHKDDIVSSSAYKAQMNLKHLQLSQYIFKQSSIIDFSFSMDNNIHNDIRLVLHALSNINTVHTLRRILFFQTTDGNDNISFTETNSITPITHTTEFLAQYDIYNKSHGDLV